MGGVGNEVLEEDLHWDLNPSTGQPRCLGHMAYAEGPPLAHQEEGLCSFGGRAGS